MDFLEACGTCDIIEIIGPGQGSHMEDKRKIWVKTARSFDEAERLDLEYYRGMTTARRLSIMQELRTQYAEISTRSKNGDREGLRRVLSVAQQT